jgi:CheY-like chemotaxis protein
MKKRVLDVGNCPPDHAAIRHLIESHFAAVVVQAHHADDALHILRQDRVDLVLVNRKLDRDYSDGLRIIREIKADPALADTPVMLITNYDDHQQRAMQAGALPGFGKLALQDALTLERLRAVLA